MVIVGMEPSSSVAPFGMSHMRWIQVSFLFALALVALGYRAAPSGKFVYDDNRQIVENYFIQNPALYRAALLSDVWAFKQASGGASSNYYRPTFVLASIVQFRLFGLEPAGWHWVNLGLHFAATALLLFLLLRLGVGPGYASISAWVFAAHPVHVESVVWIAGAPDLLVAVFGFGALLLYLRSRPKVGLGTWAAILALFALAQGSKEIAAMLVPIVFLVEWLWPPEDPSRSARLKRAALHTAPFLIVSVVYFFARSLIVGGAGFRPYSDASVFDAAASAPKVVLFHLKQIVWPFDVAPAYGIRANEASDLQFVSFWLPLLGLAAVLALALYISKRDRVAALGLAIGGLFVLPSLDLRLFHAETIARDRYLYIPLAGFAMLFLIPAAKFAAKRLGEKSVLAAGGALCVGLAYLTSRYAPVWTNDVAIWLAGVRADPKGYYAAMQLAEAFRQVRRFEEAEEQAVRALDMNKLDHRVRIILGLIQRDLGKYGEAEKNLLQVVEEGKGADIAAGHLAKLYVDLKKPDDAVRMLRTAAERDPANAAIHLQNAAVVLVQFDRHAEALRVLESAKGPLEAAKSPDAQRSWFYLAELYRASGAFEKAREAYRKFLDRTRGHEGGTMQRLREQAEAALRGL